MLRIPQAGDKVRLLIDRSGDDHNDEFKQMPAGTVFNVAFVEIKDDTGLAFSLIAPNGVIACIDKTDLVNGAYPIEFPVEPRATDMTLRRYNVVGAVFLAAGLDRTVTASSEDEAERMVREWAQGKGLRAIMEGAEIEEVDIQSCTLVD